MYYTVYKITNLINNKIYIGVHKTNNLDDNYMGSGKILKYSQEKYGIENFKKEILRVFDNPEEMFNMESELVNEEFVSRDDTYNLKNGGEGGFSHLNDSSDTHIERCKRAYQKSVDNGIHYWSSERRKKASKRFKEMWRCGVFDNKPTKTFLGKKHTEEAKMKIGKANSIKQSGSGNSQYGTMWIYNLELKECKKIKKEEFQSYEENGWLKGRKMKF